MGSTGTSLKVIKTLFDAQEAKANETMQQVSSIVSTTQAQGIVMQQYQQDIVDMKQKVLNAPHATVSKTFSVLDSKAISNMKMYKDEKA